MPNNFSISDIEKALKSIKTKGKILTDFANFDPNFIDKNQCGELIKKRILSEGKKILTLPVEKRVMEGKRLLGVSRTVLNRIIILAWAFKFTQEEIYAKRAIAEMVAVSNFEDWNPNHFLDVAEMSLALAIGFDWLHNLLSSNERDLIANALINKGIKPSFDTEQWWLGGLGNWTQVCHTGVVAAALATYEYDPVLSSKTIIRAIQDFPRAMEHGYSPSGAYSEGPMYWGYGTEFNTIFLALLENAFGTDFNLNRIQGWEQTGDFYFSSIAPSTLFYSYSDCVLEAEASLAQFYLAKRFHRSEYIAGSTLDILRKFCEDETKFNRLLPLALLFLPVESPKKTPLPLVYFSQSDSKVPVVFIRSSWDSDATFLGVKGGAPEASHGHMDSGSFVFESNHVRWVADLGMQDYHAIEKENIDLWSCGQDCQRWEVFRVGPKSHSIIQIDNERQIVGGRGEILSVIEQDDKVITTLDLSKLYHIEKVTRTFTVSKNNLIIDDALVGLKLNSKIKFQFCTLQDVIKIDKNELILQSGETKLKIRVNQNITWQVIDCDKLIQSYDSPNPKAKMVFFELNASASTNNYQVTMSL